jgi:hypothetical protein
MGHFHHAGVSWTPRRVQSSDLYNRVQIGVVNGQGSRRVKTGLAKEEQELQTRAVYQCSYPMRRPVITTCP